MSIDNGSCVRMARFHSAASVDKLPHGGHVPRPAGPQRALRRGVGRDQDSVYPCPELSELGGTVIVAQPYPGGRLDAELARARAAGELSFPTAVAIWLVPWVYGV